MDDDTRKKLWIGLPAIGAVAAAAAIGGSAALRNARRDRPHDSAPGWTTHSDRFGKYDVVGRAVTINRPRHELYAFWKDFQNLPTVMQNVTSIQPTGKDGRAVWTISAPGGRSVEVETEIVKDEADSLIAWRSVEGSDIDTEGRVEFEDAVGDRGTKVQLVIAYKAPGGEIGRLLAKAFLKEPKIQARHDLKRFKMLMETGEIATSAHSRTTGE
ncbi:cyclase [Pacificimonas flava]|uniref:Cyclase n=2 Tax=Pacificimonas TaxID=1960290 RepID=A0A219B1W8_9SPHN|nr:MULTISPECIES: SRPBCC family protein [Pacificimonas]MBZ6378266.1 SRPBCC family protein [Pacificimonas aurantium]OWV32116.1 cyclase [Pacificimonas flava]